MIQFKNCLIGADPAPNECDLTICVRGRMSGSCRNARIQFRQPTFVCETSVREGCFTAWLAKAGRYSVSYRVLNNFRRHITDLEISGSCDITIHYDAPSMIVRCRHLPVHFQSGGMVYLRADEDNFSGRAVPTFEQFKLDFEGEPDLSLNGYNRIGLVVGDEERQFPFRVNVGGVCELDYAEGITVAFQDDSSAT